MKIIAGRYKGRSILTSTKYNYRPSTSKLREAIFSILSSGRFVDTNLLQDAKILDLFAGTGILSFEAISRGARCAVLIDISKDHIDHINKSARAIGIEDCIKTLHKNALQLSNTTYQYDIVFIDPPYYNDLVPKSIQLLIDNNFLRNESILVIEMSSKENMTIPKSFNIIKEKIFGNTKLLILQYEE